jgi:hypothetical protein
MAVMAAWSRRASQLGAAAFAAATGAVVCFAGEHPLSELRRLETAVAEQASGKVTVIQLRMGTPQPLADSFSNENEFHYHFHLGH